MSESRAMNVCVSFPQEDGEGDEDSRDLVLRAEALQRQRESLLSSPQALMNAMRGGGPPSLVPPGPHLPFIPSTVGLPPTSQMPPTPGSAGSRDSSGNGTRTPSHTPEPHQSQQSWSFEEQFKQVSRLSSKRCPDCNVAAKAAVEPDFSLHGRKRAS